jgi:periplasmic protein CpxP/Spy
MSTSVSFLTAVAALAISAAAIAQPAADPANDRQAAFQQRMAERQQEMSRDLAILLDIKPGQQAALDAYLASMRPSAGMRHAGDHDTGASETEPMRLDRLSAMMEQRASMMQARIEATRHFYATLDARQQRLFDALMRLRQAMHHGKGGHAGRRFMGHDGAAKAN